MLTAENAQLAMLLVNYVQIKLLLVVAHAMTDIYSKTPIPASNLVEMVISKTLWFVRNA